MIIPFVIIIRIMRFSIDQFTFPIFRSILESSYSGEDLEKKLIKCSKGVFKTLYFGFTFSFGWYVVLRETTFHSPWMFGTGDLMNAFSDWPFTIMPGYLKNYYILSMCYYIEDMLVLLVLEPNPDFWEMILHHLIAIMLIFASYMNGFWNVGIHVLIQMDISDAFVGLIRATMDYAPLSVVVFSYLSIMITWFYFRFIAYTKCVLWTFALGGKLSVDGHSDVVTVIAFLLVSLLGLNIYWFILLAKMGYRLATKNTRIDLQNVVSEKDHQINAGKIKHIVS